MASLPAGSAGKPLHNCCLVGDPLLLLLQCCLYQQLCVLHLEFVMLRLTLGPSHYLNPRFAEEL